MVFSSILFLLIFLPATLALHFLARTFFARNLVLLAASLTFYIWGEAVFFPVLLLSITVHWGFGLLIDRESDPGRRKILLGTGIGIILLLFYISRHFRYVRYVWGPLFGAARVVSEQPDVVITQFVERELLAKVSPPPA